MTTIDELDAETQGRLAYAYAQEKLDWARAEADTYAELTHELAQVEKGLPEGLMESVVAASGGREKLNDEVNQARLVLAIVKALQYLAERGYDDQGYGAGYIQRLAEEALANRGSNGMFVF